MGTKMMTAIFPKENATRNVTSARMADRPSSVR
jgi:hypothetical protein